MQKITNADILDILPMTDGIIFAVKEDLPTGETKVSFFSFMPGKNLTAPITKGVYLLNKFGKNYKDIAEQLSDYVSCSCAKFSDGSAFIIYPTAEAGFFNKKGELIWSGDVCYNDSPARSGVPEDSYVWCAVPEKNSIIRYSTKGKKVDLRIGGEKSPAFLRPMSLSILKNELYVCCAESFKIRRISLKDYSIKDFLQFEEPVYRFVSPGSAQFVLLESGLYLL